MRVLIASATAGAGHMQAGAALEEAWRGAFPDDPLQFVDVLGHVPALQRKLYAEGYVKVVARAPELYALLFRKTDNPALLRRLTGLRRRLARWTHRKFVDYLRDFAPDVVLCPHFLPLEILGGIRARTPEFRPFTVSVVTDFEAHMFWIEPAVDFYCVAAETTKARLVARGIAPDAVMVSGIPVAAKFSTRPDRRSVRRGLGLRDDLPTLLVLGGGFGIGPVGDILDALDRIASPLQLIVVAGRNDALRRRLAARNARHPTHVLGFVTTMHEIMAVADLIVTKPGGLTTSEALALGRPLFVFNPLPGQEEANSDFLLQNGAAEKANRVEDLPYRVEQLLGSNRLAALARKAKALGRPAAAADLCRRVRELVAARS